jgi:hypothetical protein
MKLKYKTVIIAILIALCGGLTTLVMKGSFSLSEQGEVVVEGWVPFFSAQNGFKVYFPSQPTDIVKELDLPTGHQTVAYHELVSYDVDEVSYSVSYLQLPPKFHFYSASTILKTVLNLIPENGPIAKDVKYELVGHPGYSSLHFSLKEGGSVMQGRLILVKDRLFKITVTSPDVFKGDTQASLFFDSFKPLA